MKVNQVIANLTRKWVNEVIEEGFEMDDSLELEGWDDVHGGGVAQ